MERDIGGAASIIEALSNPGGAILILLALIAISSAGAVAGIMTRNMVILAGFLVGVALFLAFHTHLPLPIGVQADIILFKSKIGL